MTANDDTVTEVDENNEQNSSTFLPLEEANKNVNDLESIKEEIESPTFAN